MKRVFISHVPNTLNYGSAMMAINLIQGLQNCFNNSVEISCDCNEYNLSRLIDATSDIQLSSYLPPENQNISFIGLVKKYIFGNDITIKSISNKFDVMIVLGGDDLSETYMKEAIIKGLIYLHINRKCHVILAGQSLGPFKGIYKFVGKIVFRNLTLVTRDDNSYNFSKKELKVKHIFKGRDFAFESLPRQDLFTKEINSNRLLDTDYFVLVPSGLTHEYTSNYEGYIEVWYSIISKSLNMFPNHKVILLSHVLLPEFVSDAKVITDLMYKFNLRKNRRIISFTDPIQPAEARAILGNAHFIITGRMHAAVSAFYMKVPAISIAYSEKFYGVISQGLNLPQLVIDGRDREWHLDSEIINEIMDKIILVTESYKALTEHIIKAVEKCSEVLKDQFSFIRNEILRH